MSIGTFIDSSPEVSGDSLPRVPASRSVQEASTRWVLAPRSVQEASTRWVLASRSVQEADTRWVLAFFRKGINQCANGHSGIKAGNRGKIQKSRICEMNFAPLLSNRIKK
jgi:hypothetical protein